MVPYSPELSQPDLLSLQIPRNPETPPELNEAKVTVTFLLLFPGGSEAAQHHASPFPLV